MRKHYHVFGGFPGCYPEVWKTFRTKKDARQFIEEMANRTQDFHQFKKTKNGVVARDKSSLKFTYKVIPCDNPYCIF